MNHGIPRIILKVVGSLLLLVGFIRVGTVAFSSFQSSGSPLPSMFGFRLDIIGLGLLFVGALLFVCSFILFKKRA
jgi:hypothetical protein